MKITQRQLRKLIREQLQLELFHKKKKPKGGVKAGRVEAEKGTISVELPASVHTSILNAIPSQSKAAADISDLTFTVVDKDGNARIDSNSIRATNLPAGSKAAVIKTVMAALNSGDLKPKSLPTTYQK